jgi:hypothetical protein
MSCGLLLSNAASGWRLGRAAWNHRTCFVTLKSLVSWGLNWLGVCLEVSNSLGALECKDAIVELWTPFTESLEQTLALEDNWAKASVDYLSKLSLFQR